MIIRVLLCFNNAIYGNIGFRGKFSFTSSLIVGNLRQQAWLTGIKLNVTLNEYFTTILAKSSNKLAINHLENANSLTN